MSDETKEAEVIEVNEITEAEPTAFATHGLLPEEVEMAEKHGLVDKEAKEVDESSKEEEDGKHEKQPEPETEDSKEDESEEKKDEVKPTFDEVEAKEDNLKKYNPNEQALYWKWKSDKKKKQAAIKELEEVKANYELGTIKEKSKLKKISEALRSDNITVEQLQEIIGDTVEKTDDAPLTRADLKQIESERELKTKQEQTANQQYAERLQTAEQIGKTKYDNFEELTKLAQEVVDSDKTNTYKGVLDASFSDIDIDEEQLVERVVTIAKLNPKYGKKSETQEPEKAESNVDRVIKNSKKKISSASVGKGGGMRAISHDDLTVEDAAKLTTAQWIKLPDAVRKRLLM